MRKIITPLLMATAVTSVAAQDDARRDVLLIERVDRGAQVAQPSRGVTMNRVRDQFGEPNRSTPAVGDPPITRWHYTEFTVYFEGEFVIDSVVNQFSESEQLVRAE